MNAVITRVAVMAESLDVCETSVASARLAREGPASASYVCKRQAVNSLCPRISGSQPRLALPRLA